MFTPGRDRAGDRPSNTDSRQGAGEAPSRRGRRRLRPRIDVVELERRSLLAALPTLTALTASAVSAVAGQSVTFTATVTDLSPGGAVPNGGTVAFSDQNGMIGNGAVVDGVATFTTSGLAAGTVTVSASYGGTSGFAPSVTGTIETIAGTGTQGYTGNGGPALDADLDSPAGMAVDAEGDLFFGDEDNDVVREVVKSTGDIVTVAGTGVAGFGGNGGLATSAKLNDPRDVAVDSAGDLFISDLNNDVIREVVKATGDIRTYAGTGAVGYTGNGGPAIDADLDSARGLRVDAAGDLFFVDSLNNVVREVVKATGDILTVAGDGTFGYTGDGGPATAAELGGPNTLDLDAAGDIFIAAAGDAATREVVKATGDIITVAGKGIVGYSGDGGPATNAELADNYGVAVDPLGDVLIGDDGNNVIREVLKATGDIVTVAGTGIAGYTGDGGPATSAEMDGTGRVEVEPSGAVFSSDNDHDVIREFSPAVTVTIAPSSGLPTLTALIASTAIAGAGQSITFTATVTDLSDGGPIPTGGTVTFSDQNGVIGSGALVGGVATFTTSGLAAGTITVGASYGGVSGFAPSVTGTIATVAGNGTAGYSGDGGPATAAEIDGPSGMVPDLAGDLFFTDYDNNVVREVVKATGDITTVAGDGTAGYSGDGGSATAAELDKPIDLAIDASGDLFITDTGNNRIREVVKSTGDIITVAGDGISGYSGDGGPATAAS